MRTLQSLLLPLLLFLLLRSSAAASASPEVAKLGFFIGDVRCRTGPDPGHRPG